MNNVKEILNLSRTELERGIEVGKGSWHDQYKDSAYVFVGGLSIDLTEGDVLCVFSQVGEIVDCNLVRDKGTGKSKGFAFLAYEDQRSTVLAVDNFNGVKICDRTIRVDHVDKYKIPKKKKEDKKRKAIDTSSEDSTDSEADLYVNRGENLNPLKKREIRARVKKQLADEEEGIQREEKKEKTYKHSFYAIEETDKERKKREKKEKKKREKSELKAAKKRVKLEKQREVSVSTSSAPSEAKRRNPMLEKLLQNMGDSGQDSRGKGNNSGKNGGCYECGEQGHLARDCPKRQRR